jgi:hypothetical protein
MIIMKIRYISLAIVLLILSNSGFAQESASGTMPSQNSPWPLEYLKENFSELCQRDYHRFFDTYYLYEKQAYDCTSSKKTADFLDLARYIKGNAEVGEAFGEFSDRLLIAKPTCYLESASLLNNEALSALVRFYLWSPLTYEGQKGVPETLAKHRNNPEYQRVMKAYYRKERLGE